MKGTTMPLPSWGEITTLLVALAGGCGWLEKRRGRIRTLEDQVAKLLAKIETLTADLATAIAESEKAQRSHEATIAAKNTEIAEWRRQVERRDDRIEVLEDRLYTGGGRP